MAGSREIEAKEAAPLWILFREKNEN